MELDTKVGDVEIKLDTSRIDDNLLEAQKLLNMQVVADSAPFVPFRQGALRNSVRYPDGVYGGIVEYDTPYAHYLYKGVVYGPNIPLKDAEGNIIGWTSPPNKRLSIMSRERRLNGSKKLKGGIKMTGWILLEKRRGKSDAKTRVF